MNSVRVLVRYESQVKYLLRVGLDNLRIFPVFVQQYGLGSVVTFI